MKYDFSSPDFKQICELLRRENFSHVFEAADKICQDNFHNEIKIRALLEFSNYCKNSCKYCGLNIENKKIHRFRMTKNEIVDSALQANNAGYKTIVLQSGEDSFFTSLILGEIIKEIKKNSPNMAITLSAGEFSYDEYAYFKECGCDRYLLKHETADSEIYRYLHPNMSQKNRIECLKNLKKLSFETGGGFMVGLPFQTIETLARDLLLLKEIGCDMAGIGPFIPHPDTPLSDMESGSTELTLRCVAIARLLLPNANLPATTALGVLEKSLKSKVFSCGANIIMQKITPQKYRDDYKIYPAEIKDLGIINGRLEVEEAIISLGKIPI